MQKASKNNTSILGPLFTGFSNAVALTIALVILVSLVFRFSSVSEYHLKTLSIVIIVLSVFWGGFKSAKLAESRALFHGLGVGLLYLLASMLLAVLTSEPLNTAAIGAKLLYCSAAGIVGGIIGVSFK